MTITITAFERSPDGGKGLARDTRVRWALEEVGQPYEVRLVSFRAMKEPAHLALHPFGAILLPMRMANSPLFETGAIGIHLARADMQACCRTMPIAGRAPSHGCLPRLNTVEPPILELAAPRGSSRVGKPWHAERLPLVEARVRGRLDPLAVHLGDADWLDGALSAGDLFDGVGATQVEVIGHSGTRPQTCPPISPAAKRGPPTSERSRLNWRSTQASHRPANLVRIQKCASSESYACPCPSPYANFSACFRVRVRARAQARVRKSHFPDGN